MAWETAMKESMTSRVGGACFVFVLSALVLTPTRTGSHRIYAAQPGAVDEHDPCEVQPTSPGLAVGRTHQCPPKGSSAGVAKGDFNGDGIADLAIGVPLADVGGVPDAGAVHVIYGSATGLTATGNQMFTQGSNGVLDRAELNDRFGSALAAGDFNGDGYSDL